ncbi:uncharacterized protein [Coffea arabica]|uniref:Reverse transcriptase domain-containing protein n=1 Tax=Coffea arabica TaxID=13443 RepID=A0ABM4WMI9_COFAR
MEVYVDDMLVKSRTQEQFITNLREIFDVLRSSRMRLNPKKCTFGVRSGHSQANGQVENVNRTILHDLKTRIESVRTRWIDELSTILWAYRTTPRTATQETPFVLTYGAEAIIPAEIGVPSGRVQHFVTQDNEEEMRLNLDLFEQQREETAIRMAKYKGQVARYYNVRVRHMSFKPGDLVLRKNSVSHAVGTSKLDPSWESPYVVKETD